MPIATRPASELDSLNSSSAFTANTVEEKPSANASRSASDSVNDDSSGRPSAPRTSSSGVNSTTVRPRWDVAPSHTTGRVSIDGLSLSPMPNSSSSTPRSATVPSASFASNPNPARTKPAAR